MIPMPPFCKIRRGPPLNEWTLALTVFSTGAFFP